jgi:hypothetical protein
MATAAISRNQERCCINGNSCFIQFFVVLLVQKQQISTVKTVRSLNLIVMGAAWRFVAAATCSTRVFQVAIEELQKGKLNTAI